MNMERSSLPHLRTGPVECFILTGDQPRLGRRRRPILARSDRWILVSIAQGVADLDGGRLSSPVLACLQPGARHRLVVPPACEWTMVAFTLRHGPRHQVADGYDAYTSDALTTQPCAQAWFGVGLPVLVPAPFAASGRALLRRVCQDWWLDDLHRSRAGAQLAAWLFDWAIATRDAGAGGTWYQLAQVARRRLGRGVSVFDLAHELGCSRAQLYRRMLAELRTTPSAWLDHLRREVADRILADPQAGEAEAARACGYRNLRSFRRWLARGDP